MAIAVTLGTSAPEQPGWHLAGVCRGRFELVRSRSTMGVVSLVLTTTEGKLKVLVWGDRNARLVLVKLRIFPFYLPFRGRFRLDAEFW